MELSRQSGTLAVLGTNQQFQGIPMEYEKLKTKFVESYMESVMWPSRIKTTRWYYQQQQGKNINIVISSYNSSDSIIIYFSIL